MTHVAARTVRATPLTTNQIRGFWAAWAGWALDGMDSFIYALVLAPGDPELLPRSGIAATPDNVVSYGSVLFALFLIGWGLSMIWGPVADRFGRVRTLALTILCYSVFTLLCAFATNVWQLAAFRLLAGIGIGGEWAMGGTFVAEEWPEDRRKMGAGYLHTGYYFGFFPRRARELLHRRAVRLALDVRGRRHAGAARHVHPVRRARVEGVAAETRGRGGRR